MDQIVAKLTNLGYEVFGIILPGIIAAIFLSMWWSALGPIAPFWTSGIVPQLQSDNASRIIESISMKTGIGIAFPLAVITYFLGHILLWIARSGKPSDTRLKNSFKRTLSSIFLQIPKPENSYDPKLQNLYDAVQEKFKSPNAPSLPWVQFYPVVKSFVIRNLSQSLITTYQNKYTLHRSITLAAAGLFWLCIVAGAASALSACVFGAPHPRWGFLAMLAIASTITAWGFSDSYAYNWKLFGNTVITEAYSIIYGPNDAPNRS